MWNFGASLCSGKGDNPIPNVASAGLNGERTDAFDHYGRALLVTLAKHFTLSGHLRQKDKAFVDSAIAVDKLADQVDPSIPVNLDVTLA